MKMNKQNLWLLINTGIILVITVLFLILSDAVVPKEPEDLLFGKVVELKNETDVELVPVSGNYAVVDYKSEAFSGKTFLGTVYNVKIKNNFAYSEDYDYGMIELLVLIDPAGKVKVQIVQLNQSDWTVKGIQAYIYEKYQGIAYGSVASIPSYDAADITAGVTATDSTGSIKAIIQKAIDIHYDLIIDDPFVTIYGEGYVISNDTSFTPSTNVTKREIVKNASNVDIGYVYTLFGVGTYNNGQEDVIGHSITLKVAFDVDDEVLGVVIPEELYGHTTGNRKAKIQSYVDLLVGKTVTEFEAALSGGSDLVSGVTGTKDLVDILMDALITEVE